MKVFADITPRTAVHLDAGKTLFDVLIDGEYQTTFQARSPQRAHDNACRVALLYDATFDTARLSVRARADKPRHVSITSARIMRAVKRDDSTGICIACGKSQKFVEPDVERYTCKFSKCGQPAVYGIERLLMLAVG